MLHLPLAQVKNQLSELVSRVERGETVAVTRRGKPVAKLQAYASSDATPQDQAVMQAFEVLRQLRRGVALEGDLKSMAREGLG